jgi:TonB-dependent starch-binding outer membrane protein SusC
MSFINNVTLFKNLSVSFQLDWYQGNSIYNMTKQWLYRDRIHADFDKPVTINGETGAFVNYYNSLYNSVQRTGWFVEDGSFLRMRDVSLTYNFNHLLAKQKWIKGASLTVGARNLFTITKYTGLDPEATSSQDSQGNTTTGVGAVKGADYFGIPNLKSFLIGLNIEF